jgi:hypothetical protein
MVTLYQKQENSMKKASWVLVIYLAALLFVSLIFSWMGLSGYAIPLLQKKIMLTPMILVAIAGGLFALWTTIPPGSFKIFLIIYCSLWGIRLLLISLGNYIGQATLLNKQVNVDFIISNYYGAVSRLDTPLPFIIYWFINYFFSTQYSVKKADPLKNADQKHL